MRCRLGIIGASIILLVLSGGCSSTPDIDPPAKLEPLQSPTPVRVLWSQNLWSKLKGHDLRFAPLLHGDRLFVADNKGQVRCLNAQTGRIVWEVKTDLRIASGPSLGTGLSSEPGGGLLLFGTHDAEVLALRMDDGAVAWRSTVSSEVLAPPRATEYGVAVRTIDDKVFMLDATTGKRLWVHAQNVPILTLRGTSSPLLAGEKIVIGFANGTLAAYNARDGALVWETRVGVAQGRSELEQMIDVDADPVLVDGVIYAVSFQGRLVAVDQDSGRVLWSREMSAYADFVIDQDKIYITDQAGHVWALERSTGTALWKQDKLHGRGVTGPAAQGDFLIVADSEGVVHWLARDDGRFVARYALSEESGSIPISITPVVSNDIVFVRGNKGNLEALQLRK